MAIGVILLLGNVRMAESNTNQAASQEAALPADGPWNWAWDKVAKAAGNAQDWMESKMDEAKSVLPKMPWEMDPAELAQQTNNKRVLPSTPEQLPAPAQPAPMPLGGLFAKLVNTESGGRHVDDNGQLITSSRGAKGITQVMPATGGDPGYGVTPLQNNSPEEYLRFGRDYLNAMLKNFGNQEQAVAAYNAGPARIQKAIDRANKQGGDWKLYIPQETRAYVKKIMGT